MAIILLQLVSLQLYLISTLPLPFAAEHNASQLATASEDPSLVSSMTTLTPLEAFARILGTCVHLYWRPSCSLLGKLGNGPVSPLSGVALSASFP